MEISKLVDFLEDAGLNRLTVRVKMDDGEIFYGTSEGMFEDFYDDLDNYALGWDFKDSGRGVFDLIQAWSH
ncbi:MAG: hypothetical protein LBR77_11725 [Lachnospiraceae bacterium]|nr:hypothetical protein [Lachnospiraceae bacterium]